MSLSTFTFSSLLNIQFSIISQVSDHLWYYLKIDLRSAYYLVCIAQSNKWKMLFRTHYGLYKWLVIPFGLSNMLFAFQRFMNKIFLNILNLCVVIYLDNILIYLDSLDKHKNHIKEVLEKLWRYILYALPMKYSFHQCEIEFLEFILSPGELQIDPKKVQTIMKWPIPRQVKDI